MPRAYADYTHNQPLARRRRERGGVSASALLCGMCFFPQSFLHAMEIRVSTLLAERY